MGGASSLGASSGAAAAWPFRTAKRHMAAVVGRGERSGREMIAWERPGTGYVCACVREIARMSLAAVLPCEQVQRSAQLGA